MRPPSAGAKNWPHWRPTRRKAAASSCTHSSTGAEMTPPMLGRMDIAHERPPADLRRAGHQRRVRAGGRVLYRPGRETQSDAGSPGAATAGMLRPRVGAGVRAVQGLELSGTALGNIQLMDWSTGCLTIAAQRGFSNEFLRFFHRVTAEDGSACGRAVR